MRLFQLSLWFLVLAKQWLPSSARPAVDSARKGANSKRNQIANFIAGGVAGSISSTFTMPLEVVKTQLQSSRIAGTAGPVGVAQRIAKAEGLRGFFKGMQPMLIGIIPTRAIYFWAYSASKQSLNAKLGNTPLNHLLSAFAAGIASNTIMNPLWMVKTRFQILADPSVGQRSFRNYGDVARVIWKEEGPAGFFKGITASYVGCFEGAIQWIVYEKLKTRLSSPSPALLAGTTTAGSSAAPAKASKQIGSKLAPLPPRYASGRTGSSGSDPMASERKCPEVVPRKPSPAELFLAAAASKFAAVVATYPHEVVRTRLREQATSGVFKYRGFVGALRTIAREEGARGLYGGMGMHLLRSVPNTAIMFLSFELVSGWLDRTSRGAPVQGRGDEEVVEQLGDDSN